MHVLVVGASTQPNCGLRDCAAALAPALEAEGVEISTVWLERADELPAATVEAAARLRPDRILWHYSPFTYSSRGIPTLVRPMAAALRATGIPAVGFLHELAPAWRGRGWRGAVQAAAQRAALRTVLGAVSAAIVTAEERVAELRRPWLPRRPVEFIPLVSNVVPLGAADGARLPGRLRVGLFGFRHATLDADLVTRALAGVDTATLILVGEPGPGSAQAARWRAAAAANGAAIEFTGALEPAGLSRTLDEVDVVVSPDPPGPAPRRGTLAAALAHGRPVLALDGPRTWRPFVDEGALVVARPQDFGTQLNELAADPELRRAYGDRARAFYDRHMRPQVVAPRLRRILEAAGV